jgi:hypothetical protein
MKMKKMFKFFMCAAIMAAGFVGCSNEEVNPNPDPKGGGDETIVEEPTYATFNFVVDGAPLTRTNLTSDANENGTITSIRLLIYGADNASFCEYDTIVDVTSPDTKTATVLVRSGNKRLLVIANTKGKSFDTQLQTLRPNASIVPGTIDFTTFLGQHNLYDFGLATPAAFQSTPGSAPDGIYLTVANANLVPTAPTGSHLVYSNSLADTSCVRYLQPKISYNDSRNASGNDAANNHFIIYLQRTVAKVGVYYRGPSSVVTKDLTGTLTNLQYGVRRINRAVALFQRLESNGTPIAPYYNVFDQMFATNDAALKLAATYAPYYYLGSASELNNPLSISTTAPGSYAIPTNYYVTENSSNTALRGNVTYAAISGVYMLQAPNNLVVSAVTNYDAGTQAFAVTRIAQPTGTFYRLKDVVVNGVSYEKGNVPAGTLFTTSTSIDSVLFAMQHNTLNGFSTTNINDDFKALKQTYTGGVCYYRLNLGEGNGEDKNVYIKRNLHYKAAITGFSKIGEPTVDDLDKDPDTPISAPTNVTAEIVVLPWRVATSEDDV